MSKPLVLITADVKPIDGYNWHAAISTYIEALIGTANVMPTIMPSMGGALDLDAYLDRVDGVLITGSRSNVNPALYGGEATEANGPYDPERDASTLPLIRRTIERGVPLFAICRGIQELNVALGGTLRTEIQEEAGTGDHRAKDSPHHDERFAMAHEIKVLPDSQLASFLGGEPVEVNSLHRQALGALGRGIVVEATAEDGTIEAVTVANAPGFVLATQWHPEYWAASDGPSQKLFTAFGRAVRAYGASRGALTAAE